MRLHSLLLSRRLGFKEASRMVERWQLDPTKKGVDLGEKLREMLHREFPAGEASKSIASSSESMDFGRQLSAAERLVSNKYKKGHPRLFERATATQLEKEYLDVYTASGFLDGLRKESWSDVIKRFFKRS